MTTETKVTTEISNLEPAIPFILLRGDGKTRFAVRACFNVMKIKSLSYSFLSRFYSQESHVDFYIRNIFE